MTTDDLFAHWSETLRDQYRPDGECAQAVERAATAGQRAAEKLAASIAAHPAGRGATVIDLDAVRGMRGRG